jgi:hypothetical protein
MSSFSQSNNKKTEEGCIGCSIPFFNSKRGKSPTPLSPNDDFSIGNTYNSRNSTSSDEQDNTVKQTILEQELKVALAEHGLIATMYWPSKNSQTYEPKHTIIKKKKNEDRIECELVVDNQPKKFRFYLNEIISVNSGKGESKGVPTDIDNKLCMHFIVKDKGELNLALASETLRNDMVEGFQILAKNANSDINHVNVGKNEHG